jgi:hypothetical protein
MHSILTKLEELSIRPLFAVLVRIINTNKHRMMDSSVWRIMYFKGGAADPKISRRCE